MGKVLKAVAIIAVAVAIAYYAPTIAAGLLSATASAATTAAVTAAVTAALTLASTAAFSLLAGKPSTGNATPGIFRQSISNSFIIYGKRRVGGLLIFFHPRKWSGSHYRYFVIAVAGHRCKGVVHWWLGDEEVSVSTSGAVLSGKYAGNAWLWFYRGTEDQTAHPLFVAETGGKWTAAHRGRGTALIYAKFKLTDEIVQAGMPNITAEVEGKDDILDPRSDAQTYSRKASLVFYDWMAMPREEGGFGAFEDEVDWDWVAAQANVSDELVPTPAGPERRYEFDSYIQTGAAPSEVRDTFVTCCAGSFTYSGGKMLMRPGYYVPPSATLKEEDLAGPITVPALLAGDQAANEVAGTYIDPRNYQPAEVPTRAIAAVNLRQTSYDLPHVTSIYRGQRLLEYFLRKAQAEKRVTWPMNIVGISVSTLDTVQLVTGRYGLSNYAFQTTGWGLSQDFSVVLQLEEHGPELFEFTPGMYLEAGEAGQLALAEPIGDARAAFRITSQTVTYPVSAGDGVITIAAFTGVLDDGSTREFPAGSVADLAPGTVFGVFADRETGAYFAAPSPALEAMASAGNIFLEWAVTSAAGEYPAGDEPPPSYGGGGGRYQPNLQSK